jgi:hypothetical protein
MISIKLTEDRVNQFVHSLISLEIRCFDYGPQMWDNSDPTDPYRSDSVWVDSNCVDFHLKIERSKPFVKA